jgi:putative membrane-bound dehydrogenase-like protein
MKPICIFAVLTGVLLGSGATFAQVPSQALFDGTTLNGWETTDADQQWWRVVDGCLTGGSLSETIPHNTFLSTEQSFQNFDLKFSIKIEGAGGFVNSGFQIRSTRVEGSSEMSGYQVDAGDGWWGKLYDESRRNQVIAEALDPGAITQAVKPGEWNRYRIHAEGPRIRAWINGVLAFDYLEADRNIPLDGHFGLQVHGGGKVQVQLKDLHLQELPSTPNAMTWRRFQKAQSLAAQGGSPIKTHEQELAGFDVLDGFVVELVASDPVMNKVVDIAFDDAGRMWAITAVEYPIDGNESDDVIGMYRRGGRDQVLVFDEPWKKGPQTPRVYASNLFIPMAILPESGSVLVGQGPDILRFFDDDGDGRADRREVVLTGFGVQDSHLLPHRFVRAPGDWIYLAQGAFNASRVQTTTGDFITFNKCKVGRFQADGSRFEIVGIGLNNIWGFVIDRLGDKWVQEANDLGFPVANFEHGMSYPGIGSERFFSHSPWRPPSTEFRMGGTGLSGLAMSNDRNGFPPPWNETFFLANPIISSVQSVRANRQAATAHETSLQRTADLLTSADKNFRPVALHFGPDGCLYVVDWYNPIISHNEVPRDHPDRDKISSRIWRIRHRSQSHQKPIDVSQAPNGQLVELLSSDSTVTARAAWHQIADRQATELQADLLKLAARKNAPVEDRILALWSLQDLHGLNLPLLQQLIKSPEFALRREASRLAGELQLEPQALLALLQESPSESDPRVRLAAIDALSRAPVFSSALAAQLLRFCQPEVEGVSNSNVPVGTDGSSGSGGLGTSATPTSSAFETADFALERSLVRASLARYPDLVLQLLDSLQAAKLSPSTRQFALLCAGGAEAALQLAEVLRSREISPDPEELAFIARHSDQHAVADALSRWLADPKLSVQITTQLLASRQAWQSESLVSAIAQAARERYAGQPNTLNAAMLLRVARELHCLELEPEVIQLLRSGHASQKECLQALMEIPSHNAQLYARTARASLPGEEVRQLALVALAGVPDQAAFDLLLELWPDLLFQNRKLALNSLLRHKSGAERLLQALQDQEIGLEIMDSQILATLGEHLGARPELEKLRTQLAKNSMPGLHLSGGANDFADTQLTLRGPFTVETWVRLDPGISNGDGLLSDSVSFDLNFHDSRLRLWLKGRGDVIIANQPIQAGVWTHVALVRNADGLLSLYQNGKLDTVTDQAYPEQFSKLDIGRTIPDQGTSGWLTEFRVWDFARTASQIGDNYRIRFTAGSAIQGLHFRIPSTPILHSGSARIEGILGLPPMQSEGDARAEQERFSRYRTLAEKPGDLERGLALFQISCAVCHQVGAVGGTIGPTLDSVASKGTEGLLRSILTPNAGVESGYRILRVKTHDGQLLQGYLAADDASSITLRRLGREDLRIARKDIESLRFDPLSLMPEGLLNPMSDQQVADLFHYLLSLH